MAHTTATVNKVPPVKKEEVGLQPLGSRVLVVLAGKDDKETTTESGIIIPDQAKVRGLVEAVVVAVGTGSYQNGVHVPVGVKEGSHVLIMEGQGIKVQGALLLDEHLLLVRIGE